MKRRYFKVESDKANQLLEEHNNKRSEIENKLRELKKDVGAEDVYKNSFGHIIGVSFKDEPDTVKLYKKVEHGLYYPRKNTAEGRELAKKFESIGSVPFVEKCGILELFNANKSLMSGMTLYSTSVHVIPNQAIYISMPWCDVPLEELQRRKEKGQTDTALNSDIDAAAWVKPVELVEVKEWELQKVVDEYNDSLT